MENFLGTDFDETVHCRNNDYARMDTDMNPPIMTAAISDEKRGQSVQSPAGLSNQSDTVIWSRSSYRATAGSDDRFQHSHHQQSPLSANRHQRRPSIFHYSSNDEPNADGLSDGPGIIGGNSSEQQTAHTLDSRRGHDAELPWLQLKHRALYRCDSSSQISQQYDSSSCCASPLGRLMEVSSEFHDLMPCNAAMVAPDEGISNEGFDELLYNAWDAAQPAEQWASADNMLPQFVNRTSQQPSGNEGMHEMALQDVIFHEVRHYAVTLFCR
jgi:hypothetical protein